MNRKIIRRKNSDTPVLDEYSLWLESTDTTALRLQELIDNFASTVGTPAFAPHVTLVGGMQDTPLAIKDKMFVLARNAKELQISFSGIKTSADYFKSFFLECRETSPLMSLNASAQKMFKKSYAYHPHLNLLYGNVGDAEKNLMVEKLKSIPLSSLSFTSSKLSLWHAHGTVKDWSRVVSVPLAQ